MAVQFGIGMHKYLSHQQYQKTKKNTIKYDHIGRKLTEVRKLLIYGDLEGNFADILWLPGCPPNRLAQRNNGYLKMDDNETRKEVFFFLSTPTIIGCQVHSQKISSSVPSFPRPICLSNHDLLRVQ